MSGARELAVLVADSSQVSRGSVPDGVEFEAPVVLLVRQDVSPALTPAGMAARMESLRSATAATLAGRAPTWNAPRLESDGATTGFRPDADGSVERFDAPLFSGAGEVAVVVDLSAPPADVLHLVGILAQWMAQPGALDALPPIRILEPARPGSPAITEVAKQ